MLLLVDADKPANKRMTNTHKGRAGPPEGEQHIYTHTEIAAQECMSA